MEVLKDLRPSPDEVVNATIEVDGAISWSNQVPTEFLPVPVQGGLSSIPETYSYADSDASHAD